jgi:DNA-binding NarL/FixJ family response regulator
MVDGPRAAAAAAHAAALAADDGEALSAAAQLLADMGDLLAAADAAAHASIAFGEVGKSGRAAVAAAQALRLAQECGEARTPATDAAARPLPLTDREREIVTLVARGLSNRAIAQQLVVSVRTVEGHVYNASVKLGITGRAAFAAVLDGKRTTWSS